MDFNLDPVFVFYVNNLAVLPEKVSSNCISEQ